MLTFYENNWLECSVEPHRKEQNTELLFNDHRALIWKFNKDIIIPDIVDFNKMFAAIRRIPLGDNPYVSLSGGVDSQAMCLLLQKAGIQFTAVTLEFENNFNINDTSNAVDFCNKYNIKHELVRLDVVPFLTQELPIYAKKYNCSSPQFNFHFKFYEFVIHKFSPTCILCGGNVPVKYNNNWTFQTTTAQNSWTNFSTVNNFNLIGNFLGWSIDIALPLMMLTPNIDNVSERYFAKIEGMNRLGITVIPQKAKLTGFEEVKLYFEKLTGDGWFFEKCFRSPYVRLIPNYTGVLELSDDVVNKLEKIYGKS